MSIQATIHSEIRKLIMQRREATLKRLIAEHRSGGLSNDNMRGIVGEIAGLHFLLADAEASMKREREGDKEHG